MSRYGIVGKSESMMQLLDMVRIVSTTREPVLLLGERGTGKDLIARAIHHAAGRSPESFSPVNCGALTETLVDSELFGHVEGAFTGAKASRKGMVAQSQGGTLFLDEVGVLPFPLQARILRLAEEGEYRPVGSDQVARLRSQIVAATNVDLGRACREGRFMPDLLDRLCVFTIPVPPLRERKEDIPLLLRFFFGKKRRYDLWHVIRDRYLTLLVEKPWPGNVRQLRNLVGRIAVLGAPVLAGRDSVEYQYRLGEPTVTSPWREVPA